MQAHRLFGMHPLVVSLSFSCEPYFLFKQYVIHLERLRHKSELGVEFHTCDPSTREAGQEVHTCNPSTREAGQEVHTCNPTTREAGQESHTCNPYTRETEQEVHTCSPSTREAGQEDCHELDSAQISLPRQQKEAQLQQRQQKIQR